MTVLNDLLEQVSKSELDEQIKQICDQIMVEETKNFVHPFDKPEGSNMFLAVEFKDPKNSVSYLCLEREAKEKYIVSLWAKKKQTDIMKRKQVWEVIEAKTEKILKFYASTLKYVRGE